mgnify:FL=1
MKYLLVAEIAKKWNMSERSVRNYCAQGRVKGACLIGKTWNIPENAEKPERINKRKEEPITLVDILKEQKASKYSGGIYHKTQIELTYNSNHMEGSRLTHDQTRYIFETNTIGVEKEVLNVDDVIETANHFRCIDMIIDHAKAALTEKFIKELHLVLKNGTSDSRKEWFAVGDYKKLPNEVGGRDTALPEEVADKMKALLTEYNGKEEKTFEDILDFHVKFEHIHPFQDGNGRVGRLILFKECLRNDIVPFIIDEELKMFYYRGLHEWSSEQGYLLDTCRAAQDKFKKYLDYFRIAYRNDEE